MINSKRVLCSQGWTTVALVSALILTGCSGQGGDAESGQVQNRSQWALPSDPYNSPGGMFQAYAVDLESAACVEETGYPYVVVRYDINAPLPVTSNAAGRHLFDEKIAAEFGYHEQADPRINWDDYKAYDELEQSLSNEAWDAIMGCQREAEARLGIDPQANLYGAFPIDDVTTVDSVSEASASWRECMAPLGIADLGPEDDPYSMPTGSLSDKWGLGQDKPSWEIGPATADEIEVAVADAKCRESSGWAEARYQAEWSAEEEFLKKNRKEMDARRAQYETQEKNFLAVITKAGK